MTIDEPARLDRRWARTRPAAMARELVLGGVFRLIITTYARREILGRDQLEHLDGPVIFVANHCSHVDTPALLLSLPSRWRLRTAVAAAADYFYARRLLGDAVSLAFCTVPLERRGRGLETGATTHIDELIGTGWSLVVFAEGTRSRDGRVGRMRAGAAMLAARHSVPIVPVHISGSREAMPAGHRWMVRPETGGRWARHTIRVTFGAPLRADPRQHAPEMMERVRQFMRTCGADTTPDPKLAAIEPEAAGSAPQTTGATSGQKA